MPLVPAQIADLEALHAAACPLLHAVDREAGVEDLIVEAVVAGEAAAAAIDAVTLPARGLEADETRLQEPVLRHEDEGVRREVQGDGHSRAVVVRGRQGSPADVVVARLPVDPGRSPLVAGDPAPAVVGVVIPAAVVIGRPAEGLVRDPGPAEVGPHPVARLVGAPRCGDSPRPPDPAVPRALDPVSVGGKVVVEEADVHVGPARGSDVEPGRDRGRGGAHRRQGAEEDGSEKHDPCSFHKSPRCVPRCQS